jgi:cytochrome c oxidase subunit 2
MSFWSQINFQDRASLVILTIQRTHDYYIIVILLISTILLSLFLFIFFNKNIVRENFKTNKLEIFWTLAPFFILLALAIPSLRLLYLTEEASFPKITLKVIGHQWYWSYQYHINNLQKRFDSFLIQENNLNPGDFRLLSVDQRAVLPFKTNIRFIISSADVIHAWTVPRLLLKLDAIPGRLNQLSSNILFPGIFFGQCSEICGANHSFIPIVLEVIRFKNFFLWIKKFFLVQNNTQLPQHSYRFIKF